MKRWGMILVALGMFACIHPGYADEITLEDGTVLKGHVGAEGYSVVFFVPDDESLGKRWVSRREITSIKKDAVPAAVLKRERVQIKPMGAEQEDSQ